MGRFVVTATGGKPQVVDAPDWLAALGVALREGHRLDAVSRLACEVLPNGTVTARDVLTGTGFVVVPTDATPAPVERRQPQERFTVGDLPAQVFRENLRHDLRTPLGNLLEWLDLLMEEQPRLDADLRRISGCAHQLLDLVDACFDAARAANGEVFLQLESFDLRPVLVEVAAHAEGPVTGRRNTISVSCGAHVRAHGDRQCLREVLLRCLTRTNEGVTGGELVLRGELHDRTDAVHVHVLRSGPPLSVEARAHAFQVFGRTDDPERPVAAKTVRLGTSREIVRRMGGDLVLQDPANGFLVRLPLGFETSAEGRPPRPVPGR